MQESSKLKDNWGHKNTVRWPQGVSHTGVESHKSIARKKVVSIELEGNDQHNALFSFELIYILRLRSLWMT